MYINFETHELPTGTTNLGLYGMGKNNKSSEVGLNNKTLEAGTINQKFTHTLLGVRVSSHLSDVLEVLDGLFKEVNGSTRIKSGAPSCIIKETRSAHPTLDSVCTQEQSIQVHHVAYIIQNQCTRSCLTWYNQSRASLSTMNFPYIDVLTPYIEELLYLSDDYCLRHNPFQLGSLKNSSLAPAPKFF